MLRSAPLGVLIAVGAAIATTLVVLAVVGDGDPPKRPPVDALQPGQITKLPLGTLVPQGINEAEEFGGFKVIPESLIPARCPAPGRADAGRPRVEVAEAKDPAEFASHDLLVEPPYIPSGWGLTEAHAETATWADGEVTGTKFALYYEREGHFPITVTRLAVEPSCVIEFVTHPEGSNDAYTFTRVAGQPALIQHQAPGKGAQIPLEVHVRNGSVVLTVEGRAVDLDELIKVAEEVMEVTS